MSENGRAKFLASFLFLLILTACLCHANQEGLVVQLNDVTISEAELAEKRQEFKEFYPQAEEGEIHERVTVWLIGHLRETVYETAIMERTIDASPKEIQDRKMEMLKQLQDSAVSEEDVNRLNKFYHILGRALEEYARAQEPKEANKIFQKYEKQLNEYHPITLTEWKVYISQFNNQEKLKEFYRMIPSSTQDLVDKSEKAIIKDIQIEKLKQSVTADVQLTELEKKEIVAACQLFGQPLDSSQVQQAFERALKEKRAVFFTRWTNETILKTAKFFNAQWEKRIKERLQ